MKAKVKVYLKEGILDPQGKAVLNAIRHMNYQDVEDVRIGKYIEIEVNSSDRQKMQQQLDEICRRLLSNPLMENYEIEW